MGARFDQWLAKPSTIHFLRQLISPLDPSTASRLGLSCGDGFARRARKLATSATVQERSREDSHRSHEEKRQAETLRKTTRTDSATKSLHVSLKASSSVVHEDIKTKVSFEELRCQARVESKDSLGNLLVDAPENRGNMKLWIELLHFKQRLHGLQGVAELWEGMQMRNIELPTSGEDADVLWTTFTNACISDDRNRKNSNLLSEVFEHAKSLKIRTGLHYVGLYKCIVGRWFRVQPTNVLQWHNRLVDAGLTQEDGVTSVAVDAICSTRQPRALIVFNPIYLKSDQRNLYDAIIGQALELKGDVPALMLHRWFLKAGDGPSTEMFATPGVQRLFELDKDQSLPMKSPVQDRKQDSRDIDNLKKLYPPISRASMNTIVGDVHGIKPKKISDHFCAKLFATRAFTLDIVIKGLFFFGVEKLGPLAIREMAIRAASSEDFSEKLQDLRSRGIKIGDDVYSQTLVRVANDGLSRLWTLLCESDQHPDTYGDAATQEALLTSFINERKWAEAHISLLALSIAGARSSTRAWNLLLQYYLDHHEYRPMLNTFQNMRSQGISLNRRSVHRIFYRVLPERQVGKRTIKGQGPKFFDPSDFVANALIYASEHGLNVHWLKWKELLKRYGMDHRFSDVERLVLWLVDHYSPGKSASLLGVNRAFYLQRKRLHHRTQALRLILDPKMLKAIFVWGFRGASTRGLLRPLPRKQLTDGGENSMASLVGEDAELEEWAQGLALLRILSLGDLDLSIDDVRAAFVLRMWILFGPAYSTRPLNNEARRVNKLSLRHYINHANEIWPGMVDWVDHPLLERQSEDRTAMALQFFGTGKRVSLRRREYADVGAWLQHPTSLHTRIYEKRNIPAKRHAWESSGLRLYLPFTASRQTLEPEHEDTTHPLPEHQPPAARSESSRLPPSPQYTLERL